jgi:hypothetical protein
MRKAALKEKPDTFARNHWVPVPEEVDAAALNRQLLTACQEDEHRLIAGREQVVGTGLIIEREHLLPLPEEGIDLAQTSFPTVNGLGCAKVAKAALIPVKLSYCQSTSRNTKRSRLWLRLWTFV